MDILIICPFCEEEFVCDDSYEEFRCPECLEWIVFEDKDGWEVQ